MLYAIVTLETVTEFPIASYTKEADFAAFALALECGDNLWLNKHALYVRLEKRDDAGICEVMIIWN